MNEVAVVKYKKELYRILYIDDSTFTFIEKPFRKCGSTSTIVECICNFMSSGSSIPSNILIITKHKYFIKQIKKLIIKKLLHVQSDLFCNKISFENNTLEFITIDKYKNALIDKKYNKIYVLDFEKLDNDRDSQEMEYYLGVYGCDVFIEYEY